MMTLAAPSCLYFLPMISATFHCCMIPTKCSSGPCIGFLSWKRRLYIIRSFCAHVQLLSILPLMEMPLPPFCIHHPLLMDTLALFHSLWCPPAFPCSHFHLTLTFIWLCLAFEGSQREVLFGIRIKRPWPAGTRLPSLPRLFLHPFHPLSLPQAKVVFCFFHHHWLAELNGSTFKVILSTFLLDLSQIWPRLHSQHTHTLLFQHPSLPRHLLQHPRPHLLCLLWRNSMLKRNNYNWKSLKAKLLAIFLV
jgi:hypothetical protein